MSDALTTKPPAWYYVVATIGLLWNLFGVLAYVMQVSTPPEVLAEAYSAEQVQMLLATPAWATSATAIATNIGALGCIFLLIRKSWAVPAFLVSFAALIVQDIYLFGMIDSVGMFGSFPLVLQSMVFVGALLLIWFSRSVANKYYR